MFRKEYPIDLWDGDKHPRSHLGLQKSSNEVELFDTSLDFAGVSKKHFQAAE